ncbi:anaerobic ribonucleoside-triphosphate reductase [Burkholderiaceae bacterium DAT-1]|nr:anaerobic ribonucleoside-triphosphate reductase [Burkholderiaceae bacterium DAT-1]
MSQIQSSFPEHIDPDLRTRCEVWTRVMGYHRPVASFNTGKKGEFNERTFFKEPGIGQGMHG